VSRLLQFVRAQLFTRAAGHFAALDGMRALAALIVVAYHCEVWHSVGRRDLSGPIPAWLHTIFHNFWLGVDIFFVLSGFLIGRILLAQLQRRALSFSGFYLRRSFRIFPAYYIILTLSVLLFARMPSLRRVYEATPWETIALRSWANYLYISNYTYGIAIPNALGWGWSLCIEEHFYLFLPLFLATLFRYVKSDWRLRIMMAITLLPLTFRLASVWKSPEAITIERVYADTHTHCDGLLFGVVIAYLHVFHSEWLTALAGRLGHALWLVAFCCFGAVLEWGGGLHKPGLFPVALQFSVLALGSGLLLVNGLYGANWCARLLAHPAWYPFARLSYGIYLVHIFVVLEMVNWWPQDRQVTLPLSLLSLSGYILTATLVSVFWAAVLFFTVERPMLERGARLTQRYTDPPVQTR